MNDYVITSDSACDLTKDFLLQNHIDTIPLYYNIENVIYGEDKKMDISSFYNKMRSGIIPKTMACNPDTTEKIFRKHLSNGQDILHISFSSKLSSCCNTACLFANDLKEEFPNRKIIIIDSLSASLGQGLLIYYAVQNKNQNMSITDNESWLNNHKLNIRHLFTVDDLHYLYAGGRISKSTAIIGSMINVKPILFVDNNGYLISHSNVHGRRKALNTLLKQMADYEATDSVVFISHSDCIEDAIYLKAKIIELYNIQNIMINYVSPTIGSHCGPGTIALFYLSNNSLRN